MAGEKLEEKIISTVLKETNLLGSKVKAGDVIEVLIAVIVISLIVLTLAGNATTFLGPVADIVFGLLFVLLILTTAIRFNAGIRGLLRFLPACHDINDKIVYCARHKGLHIGILFWSTAIIILNQYVVGLTCTLNDSIWFGPFLLIMLLGLPAHGLKTKMGGKTTLEFKFWSAFFWVLVVICFGFYLYYTLAHPC